MELWNIQKAVHRVSKEHGWWENSDHTVIPTKLMLMVSELAEALEEYRDGRPPYYVIEGKPEGLGVELADCVIRILDLAEFLGLNMEDLVLEKHAYNKTRSFKHGGKVC